MISVPIGAMLLRWIAEGRVRIAESSPRTSVAVVDGESPPFLTAFIIKVCLDRACNRWNLTSMSHPILAEHRPKQEACIQAGRAGKGCSFGHFQLSSVPVSSLFVSMKPQVALDGD